MTPASVIRAALLNGNIAAFLRVLRQGESSQDSGAYAMVNGAPPITDFSAHPYTGLKSPPGRSSGAYQFLATTWDAMQKLYPQDMPNFSPASQDFAAVADIAGHGALDDVLAGRFDSAVAKLPDEWISLRTLKNAKVVYQNWGGKLATGGNPPIPAQPIPDTPVRTETLTDIPSTDLGQTVAEFKAAGASVVQTKQSDGRWTVIATFGGKP